MLKKGQGATELLILLAVVALVGLVIYASGQSTLAESKKAFLISQARAAVNDLASAASEVYLQGVGAKRNVYVVIPEGVEPSRVYINNTIINIGVRIDSTITDVNTQTSMRLVQGIDFPTTPGSYWIPVTAKEGYVLIGNSYLNIEPSSVSLEVLRSNSTTAVVRFTNFGPTPISVTLSPEWAHNGTVDLSLNTTAFTLASSGDEVTSFLLATVQTYSNTPLQTYSGKIVVITNTTERAEINFNVNVVGVQLPKGVSYIVLETFKNSSYSTPTTNFTLPTPVNITGVGWMPGVVSIDIKDPSGNSLDGYPIQVSVGDTNTFSHIWNPAGVMPGQYTVVVNQSTTSSATYFNVTVCP